MQTTHTFVRMNDGPVEIESVIDEHDENMDYEPSFWWNNRRYYLTNFIRCHNNPWIYDDFPPYIHAYESDNYYSPLYIELLDDSSINIYEEK